MGPFLFLYAALAGFFAFAAIYHLVLWWPSRRETLLSVFSLDCGLRAVYSGVLVAVATSTTPAEAHGALRTRIALGMLMTVTWIWSLSLVAGVRARRLVWAVTILFLALFTVQTFVVPLNSPVISVERFTMPWGETISNPQVAPPGWWFGPLYATVMAIEIWGLFCGARLWARDRLAGTLLLSATGGILLIHSLQVLRGYRILSIPVIGVVPQVFWVCVVALLIARGNRRTQERLAASEERFRGIFDQTFQFIGLIRTDGTLIEANRTALEFASLREEDVIGKPFWETPWWAHSSELQSQLREAIVAATAGNTVRFEATHLRPDGRLAFVDFSLKPVHNEQGRVTMLIPEGRDITERKEAEEERRVLEAKLIQAQKMETIGRLAGGVAHDFNNLLTVINGNSELLRTMTLPDDKAYSMLDGILDAGERAAALNRQLLTFSRQQVVEPRVLDLNTVVVETEKMLRRLIGEDLCLVTLLYPNLACVNADAGQVGQVIMNLAVNARDAMPTGGKLTIQTSNIEIDTATSAMHPGAMPGQYVVLAVSDTGSGMTPEVQARIFEPFFSTKGPGKGTGLGLATVRTIAEESGGFLSVASTPGQGSTIKLYLPVLAGRASMERATPDAKAAPRGSETILLVEDDEAVRLLTRRMLQQFGYSVVEASGGTEAIRLFAQHLGTIDLLITDVVMPEIGGRNLVERLAVARQGLKVLYMSGYTDDAVVRHGVLVADVAFLQKPFTMETLASKVRQLLDAASTHAM